VPWKFEISSGKVFDPVGTLAGLGYAGGNKGQDPAGVNNPADESLKDIGPLPEGRYAFGEPVEHSQLGPFAIPLIPDPGNEMYGRGSFYIHGDTADLDHSASEGCLILARNVREEMWASPDHLIQVVSGT